MAYPAFLSRSPLKVSFMTLSNAASEPDYRHEQRDAWPSRERYCARKMQFLHHQHERPFKNLSLI
jgi:hypothetical protein